MRVFSKPKEVERTLCGIAETYLFWAPSTIEALESDSTQRSQASVGAHR